MSEMKAMLKKMHVSRAQPKLISWTGTDRRFLPKDKCVWKLNYCCHWQRKTQMKEIYPSPERTSHTMRLMCVEKLPKFGSYVSSHDRTGSSNAENMPSKLNSVLPHENSKLKRWEILQNWSKSMKLKINRKKRKKEIIRYWIPFFQLFGMARNFVANICRVYESLPLRNPIKLNSNVEKAVLIWFKRFVVVLSRRKKWMKKRKRNQQNEIKSNINI